MPANPQGVGSAVPRSLPDTAPATRPAAPVPRALADLLRAVPGLRALEELGGTTVTGCTLDSRAVRPGDLYAALPGTRAHGAEFAAPAVAAGAVAVLTDEPGAARIVGDPVLSSARGPGPDGGPAVPVLVAADPRGVLGAVAGWVHGDPAAGMVVVGITGTNGKTTTAFLVEAGLRAAGHRTGLIGTVLTRIGDDVVPSVRTTPEAPDVQALLAVMRERGTTAVAMEVSSHALSLGRVDGVRFDVAGFTNLSQDHLDFHGSMAEYEAAKASLFTPARTRTGVVNVDDPAGRRIVRTGAVPVVTFGGDADWTLRALDLRPDGSRFRLLGPGVDVPASVRLPGAFNAANALAALACLVTAGVPVEQAVTGVAACPGVPGRMERVDVGQPFLALVDYAHTPDAVSGLVRAARALTRGRVLLVLGCGGDRDRAKRPRMGAAAAEADVAVLTSDNPRSEDPLAILAEMAAGAPDAAVEPDRRAAIARVVAEARPGDAVVVAGKGHEMGQEAGGVTTPFDDRTVLREVLREVLSA